MRGTRVGITGALVLGAFLIGALSQAAPALADPEPPTAPPTAAPAPAGIGNVLAQNGSESSGPFGLPDLSAYGGNILLGQNAAPTQPGAPASAVVPSLNAFNPQYLLGQNLSPAAPGQGSPAPGLGPDQNSPGTGRIAFLRRLHQMYQAGELRGALLGQQSPAEFDADVADAASPPPG